MTSLTRTMGKGQQAFTVNMELGMLVRGGTRPGRVEEQFRRLIQDGQLRPV